ncbi:MAG: BatA domain-containing protein [Planctomycetes bacterium]|nr:BatA domain-containing protein [Planctomycetota bacterium]
MNFLQPWMLLALPLAAIPIIIHLVNQRRFQTVPWAAMRFLLEATKMSSGYTKLRQWLILAMRTLALLALVMFTARPLTSGLLALLGGDANRVAIVILDRSPSMEETPSGANATKLQQGIDQLGETFKTLGIQRIVQLDPLADKPEEFASVSQWLRATPRQAWSATSDIPSLLEKALLYAKNNPSGNTMVWLCSDMRDSDWRSQDGRWKAIQDGFRSIAQQVRFSILDLSQSSTSNRSLRITDVHRVETDNGPELSISFRIDKQFSSGTDSSAQASTDSPANTPSEPVPVEITVGDNRSIVQVEFQGNTAQLADYRIPLEKGVPSNPDFSSQGWGSVRLPADTNPSDDIEYFVFERSPKRRTVIVTQTPELVQAIELCASISPQQAVECEVESAVLDQFESIDLGNVAMIVWQENLPTGKALETLNRFVSTGGQLLILPPENADGSEAFGVRWGAWESLQEGQESAPIENQTAAEAQRNRLARIAQWQNDSQLLSNTLSGAPLPLGQLGIRRLCKLDGTFEALASLPDGKAFLATAPLSAQDPTPITLCATTPADRDSTLAGDGVVLYVTIQRMLSAGAQRVGTTKNASAGTEHRSVDATSKLVLGSDSALSSEFAMHSGVYRNDSNLVALHRDPQEDSLRSIDSQNLERMFGDLPWAKIEAGKRASSLVQEIWRWFVVAMLGALLIEAVLCLPKAAKRKAPAMAPVG